MSDYTRTEAEQIYRDSNGVLIACGWHYCSEHERLEPDDTCEVAKFNGEDDSPVWVSPLCKVSD